MIRFAITATMAPNDVGVVHVGGYLTPERISQDEDAQTTPARLRQQLDAIKSARALEVHINSPGGEVFAAIEMRQALLKHPAAHKTVHIDGLCASAATLLACIDAPIVMTDGAYIMIHNPVAMTMGDYRELRAQADVLKSMADQFANIYARATNQPPEYINELMDAETWLTAEDAKALGFAVETADESADMLPILISPMSTEMRAIYHNVPNKLFEASPNMIPEMLLPNPHWPAYAEQQRCYCDDADAGEANILAARARALTTAPAAESKTIKGENALENYTPASPFDGLRAAKPPDGEGSAQARQVNTATMEKEAEKLDWKEITLEGLRDNRPDICAQIEAQAAEAAVDAERRRLREIDEAAGLSDALADRAKYADCVSAGEYALMALKQMRTQQEHANAGREPAAPRASGMANEHGGEAASCAQSYLTARAQETAQMQNVGHAPVDINVDDEAAALARLLK